MPRKSTPFTDRVHRLLSRSEAALRVALKVRNQATAILSHALSDGIHPTANGEELLLRHSTFARTFVDVGAHRGAWTELCLSILGPSARGLLIEPSPSCAEGLRVRFRENSSVRVLEAAAAAHPGQSALFQVEEKPEQATIIMSPGLQPGPMVRVLSLDDELPRHSLGSLDFLKIDAEGSDYWVLQGAEHLLSRHAIGVIQFEYNASWAPAGATLAGAVRYLEGFGYSVFLLKRSGLHALRTAALGEYFRYSNFVAIRADRLPSYEGMIQRQATSLFSIPQGPSQPEG